MLLKKHIPEIVLLIAVAFMSVYPPIVGAILFGLAVCAIAGLRFIDSLHQASDDKLEARVTKLANDVERIVLRGGGR